FISPLLSYTPFGVLAFIVSSLFGTVPLCSNKMSFPTFSICGNSFGSSVNIFLHLLSDTVCPSTTNLSFLTCTYQTASLAILAHSFWEILGRLGLPLLPPLSETSDN